MITYETLRRIEQEEKNSAKLARLPEHFLVVAREYLEQKERIAREKGDRIEFQSASQRLQNILDIRERKLVNFALYALRSEAVPENMLPEENQLLDALVAKLREFRDTRGKAMSGERPRMRIVAFLQKLPEFVGIDMGQYGPFSQGDIATVPEENAKVLMEKGAAELIAEGK